ncbi:hypothetical protein MA16_Dca008328 [Dendrobium catenatum]|uniref:Uncharacterized protein n=1 Tax=Dendrobium catenatum TaxID=906689 RepID=A0A2I0W814_9ASPA|nr:hypothetical protein MA16_Dca008328 [Dendrobium catenatum]
MRGSINIRPARGGENWRKRREAKHLKQAREKEGSGVICVTQMGRVYSLRKNGELTHQ